MSKSDPNKPPKYAMVVDPLLCFNCKACVVACQMENGVPVGKYRNWIKTGITAAQGDALFQPGNCMQCDEPSCVAACPVGATYKNRDGRVLIRADKCISCGNCVAACPYGARYLDKIRHRADKCDFCESRLLKGLEPACVVTCPTRARVFGDLNDAESQVSRLLKTRRHFAVRNARIDTRPNLFYLSGLNLRSWPAEPTLPGRISMPDTFWKK